MTDMCTNETRLLSNEHLSNELSFQNYVIIIRLKMFANGILEQATITIVVRAKYLPNDYSLTWNSEEK